MITVACILNGEKYGAEWVHRLERMVHKHMTVEHNFVCLTTRPKLLNCPIVMDESGWPTWWAKLNLFNLNNDVRLHHPDSSMVYMDIDTVIVGSLDWLADFKGRFGVIADVYRPGGFGGGVFVLGAGFGQVIYDEFVKQPEVWMKSMHSDMWFYQKFPEYAQLLTSMFPGKILSYKAHCQNGVPEGASIIRFHGQPKMDELPANHPLRVAWDNA